MIAPSDIWRAALLTEGRILLIMILCRWVFGEHAAAISGKSMVLARLYKVSPAGWFRVSPPAAYNAARFYPNKNKRT
jgi:hypothetical protein